MHYIDLRLRTDRYLAGGQQAHIERSTDLQRITSIKLVSIALAYIPDPCGHWVRFHGEACCRISTEAAMAK